MFTVQFATNRNLLPRTKPQDFGTDALPEARFGTATLRRSGNDWKLVDVQVDAKLMSDLFADPIEMATALVSKGLDTPAPDTDLRILSDAARTLVAAESIFVHIHGGAWLFHDALVHTAELAHRYGQTTAMLFSHPTNGSYTPWGYFADRRDATVSGPAIASAFRKWTEFSATLLKLANPAGVMNMLVHSMGAYALRFGVQALVMNGPRVAGKIFDAVALAAADEDNDTLSKSKMLGPLVAMSKRIAVYHSTTDILCGLSDLVHPTFTPLGITGPLDVDTERYPGCDVAAIDCTRYGTDGDVLGHRYYARNAYAVEDIANFIKGASTSATRAKISRRRYALKKPDKRFRGVEDASTPSDALQPAGSSTDRRPRSQTR